MRLIIFVPTVRGAIRTWRSVAYGANHLGHTVIRDAPITTSAEVRAILDLGEADMVACRPRHLDHLDRDLHARALPIPVVRAYRGLIAAIGLPWLVEQIRRHPGRAAAAGATLAGIATAVMLLAPRGDDEKMPPDALPPPQPSPTVSVSRPPASPRLSSPAHVPGGRQGGSRPASGSVAAPPRPSATPRPAASSPPGRPSPPTVPSSTPTPPREAGDGSACILRLRLPGLLDVGVCLDHPSS